MPGENLERARGAYETSNRGDIERFVADFIHPEYEFHTGARGGTMDIPEVVRGHDGLRAWMKQWFQEPWEEQLQIEVERLEELDDRRVLALLMLRAKGHESGVPIEMEYAHILAFRDGLCIRMDGFPSWRAALKAAGLAE